MQSVYITLKNIQQVRDFVKEVVMLDYEVDLEQGRYVVDAKSIMGIFALDLLSPIKLVVHSDHAEDFLEKIAQFRVQP